MVVERVRYKVGDIVVLAKGADKDLIEEPTERKDVKIAIENCTFNSFGTNLDGLKKGSVGKIKKIFGRNDNKIEIKDYIFENEIIFDANITKKGNYKLWVSFLDCDLVLGKLEYIRHATKYEKFIYSMGIK